MDATWNINYKIVVIYSCHCFCLSCGYVCDFYRDNGQIITETCSLANCLME